MSNDTDRLTICALIAIALVLVALLWQSRPDAHEAPPPVLPTQTPWVIVVTATPPAVPVGPVLPTRTPPPMVRDLLPTRTPLATRTPTVPPTPDWLPTTPTPARSPTQRG